ncbi:hypothetical protein Micbo1qcDRAFT_158154, partial [Microdochium bolleyi]
MATAASAASASSFAALPRACCATFSCSSSRRAESVFPSLPFLAFFASKATISASFSAISAASASSMGSGDSASGSGTGSGSAGGGGGGSAAAAASSARLLAWSLSWSYRAWSVLPSFPLLISFASRSASSRVSSAMA